MIWAKTLTLRAFESIIDIIPFENYFRGYDINVQNSQKKSTEPYGYAYGY